MNGADAKLQLVADLLDHRRAQHLLRNLNEKWNAWSGDEGFHTIEQRVATACAGGFDLYAISGKFGKENVGEWKRHQGDRNLKVAAGNAPAITVPGSPAEIQVVVAGAELALSAVGLDIAAQESQVWKKGAEIRRHSSDVGHRAGVVTEIITLECNLALTAGLGVSSTRGRCARRQPGDRPA